MEQKSRVAEHWNATLGHRGQTGNEGDSISACRRRWLPGEALVKLDVRLRLADEVVGHSPASAQAHHHRQVDPERGRSGRAWRLTDEVENRLDGSGIGDQGDDPLDVCSGS